MQTRNGFGTARQTTNLRQKNTVKLTTALLTASQALVEAPNLEGKICLPMRVGPNQLSLVLALHVQDAMLLLFEAA
jgi:hypothetical protein